MDKNREGRRGGAISNRHVSAPRRSRASGIKYSSVNNAEGDETVENEMNSYSKGQERSKKFSGRVCPCLQDSDSHKDSDRPLHKKRRVGSPLDHAIGKDRVSGSDDPEIGESDEEYYDLAPPSLSTRPWKLKRRLKDREELSPIDPIIIPRKTLTAMTKRQQDSSHRNHLFDVSKQRGPGNARPAFAQTCSNINSNHVGKRKLDSHKPSTSKSAKTLSTRVSKTEVEVAETLFDLAKMFTAHYSASDLKSESLQPSKSGPANSATRSDVKPSPGVSSIDVSSVIASRVNDVLEKTISNDNASNVDLARRSPLESAERGKINIDLMTLPNDIVKSDDTFNAGLANANGDGKTHLYNSNLEGAAKPTAFECKQSEKQNVLRLGVDCPAEGVENVEIDKYKRDLSQWSRENETCPCTIFGYLNSYYSPMAAAAAARAASWLKPVPMAGIASNESSVSALQLPSFFMPPRQPRKRCATHVYITQFINGQEQLKSNSLWTAAYANSPWNRAKEKELAD